MNLCDCRRRSNQSTPSSKRSMRKHQPGSQHLWRCEACSRHPTRLLHRLARSAGRQRCLAHRWVHVPGVHCVPMRQHQHVGCGWRSGGLEQLGGAGLPGTCRAGRQVGGTSRCSSLWVKGWCNWMLALPCSDMSRFHV